MIAMQKTCSACPTQFSGTINGYAAYFRARWNWWTLTIAVQGKEPVGCAREDVLYFDEGRIGEEGDDMLGVMEDDRCQEVFRRAEATLSKDIEGHK